MLTSSGKSLWGRRVVCRLCPLIAAWLICGAGFVGASGTETLPETLDGLRPFCRKVMSWPCRGIGVTATLSIFCDESTPVPDRGYRYGVVYFINGNFPRIAPFLKLRHRSLHQRTEIEAPQPVCLLERKGPGAGRQGSMPAGKPVGHSHSLQARGPLPFIGNAACPKKEGTKAVQQPAHAAGRRTGQPCVQQGGNGPEAGGIQRD